MRAYTDKALHVVEMVQLKFDRDKLKVEIKLSAMMIDRQKEELKQARIARDEEAKRSGSGKVAKPVTQQLLSIDNSVKQSMARHEAMLLDLAQMEKRLGPDSSPNN
jgi:ribosome maturation protein Sdo1